MSEEEQRIRNVILRRRQEIRKQELMVNHLDRQRSAINEQQKFHIDAIAECKADIHVGLLKIKRLREKEAQAAAEALLAATSDSESQAA